jgi:hypothetical protein
MSKERYNQIIDEVYDEYINFSNSLEEPDYEYHVDDPSQHTTRLMTKEEFIHKCKTDQEFTKKWRLKIEERKLSSVERWEWYGKNGGPNGEILFVGMIVYQNEEDNSHVKSWLEKWAPNVPTKQITLTYQDESIQFYE